nr:SNF2-related protein [uncultured Desulfobacter sp.]
MTSQNPPSTENDPLFFDHDRLEQLAAPGVISLGLTFFKENRVITLDQEDRTLWAQVEDEERSDFPLDIEIEIGADNTPLCRCDCDESHDGVCAHMVAALYAYADQRQTAEGILSASDTAISDRIKRGKSEVKAEPLSADPWLGEWTAASIAGKTAFPRQYRVMIRNLHKRANYCSCPDFANNQLGTCKHIEAALHKIKKHPKYNEFKDQAAPLPYVYLAWDKPNAPIISLHRSKSMADDLGKILDDHFTTSGDFSGRIPEDFLRFASQMEDREDIHVGEDALNHARQIAAEASQKLRCFKILEMIENSGRKLPGVKAALYPYQVQGTGFLAGNGRALLADDMGLGKTLQAIAAAVWLKNNENIRTVMIICPASLKQQWAREIAKFTDLQCQIIQGPPPKRSVQYRREKTFFVINYELLLRDLSMINETLQPDLVILDEAQRIKNWRTKISAAVKLIPSRFAFVLTGTPLENRLEDLYSLMQVVNPKILGPLWRYMVDYHVTDERGKILGYRNLSILRRRLEPVMLRRDRSIVSDQLPERIVQQLDVPMTSKQREFHDDAMSKAGQLATIAKRRPLTPSEQNRLIAALQQARMACNAAGLVDKETIGSPKIDEMADLLDEICIQSGLKAVVFSCWELMTQMVEKRLRKMGLGYVRLHGGVPTAKRGELMDRFQNDDAVQVFISTDAGGVGLNLQSGSALINMDVPWNPAVLEQRNARIHRLGQKRSVQIITLVAAASYEEQVLSLVNTKQHLFDNVVKEDATEDVVGVSKKMIETLIDELAPAKPADNSQENLEETYQDQAQAPDRPQDPKSRPMNQDMHDCIKGLQEVFGPRIERIFGSKGSLIAVIDHVDGEAEQAAIELSKTIPVALIDLITLNSLNRLGEASPLAQMQTCYDVKEEEPAISRPSRLEAMAQEKFNGAKLLIGQGLHTSAMELLLSSQLATASHRAGLNTPKSVTQAGVWIYSDAMPKNVLNQKEASLIMQTIGLSQAPEVPGELVEQLFKDTAGFIDQVL